MTSDSFHINCIVDGLENGDIVYIILKGELVTIRPVRGGSEVCTMRVSSHIVRMDCVKHVSAQVVDGSELVLVVGSINEVHLSLQEISLVFVFPKTCPLEKSRVPLGLSGYLKSSGYYLPTWGYWDSMEQSKPRIKKSKTLRRI